MCRRRCRGPRCANRPAGSVSTENKLLVALVDEAGLDLDQRTDDLDRSVLAPAVGADLDQGRLVGTGDRRPAEHAGERPPSTATTPPATIRAVYPRPGPASSQIPCTARLAERWASTNSTPDTTTAPQSSEMRLSSTPSRDTKMRTVSAGTRAWTGREEPERRPIGREREQPEDERARRRRSRSRLGHGVSSAS